MRVNSLSVENYKNLTARVTFGPLDQISVLHGPNNIGKSNLLGALDLFFGLLAAGTEVSKDQSRSMDPEEQIEGHPFAEIFNATDAAPIRLQVELSLPEEELRANGVEPERATDPTTITLELTPVATGAQLRVTQFQMANADVARDTSGPVGFGESLRAYVAGTFFLQKDEGAARPFTLLDPYRSGAEDAAAGLVPQRVLDALFDAQQSLDRDLRSRWGLFQQAMRSLSTELGPGEFETAFDRSTGRANLVFASDSTTLAIHRLGAGVQRMVALVGSLVLARGAVVGLGEPELGLSPSAQQRWLRAVRSILAAPAGPSQLLFTTHSPVLGAQESAFAMELQEGAPAIIQRSWEGAGVLQSLDDLSGADLDAGAGPADLDQLIGLVDQLSEIEPGELVAAGPAANRPPQRAPAGKTAGEPEPAASAPPGTPPWKWQPK